MPEQPFATGKSEQEFIKSGRSGFFSVPHKLYFFDDETPPPLPKPAVVDKPVNAIAVEVKQAVKKEPKNG